jgi:hypothetical protein
LFPATDCGAIIDESLIAEVIARFGMSREETIEDLILNGGIADSAAFV